MPAAVVNITLPSSQYPTMSESQLKKLKAEKDRLDVEAETVKELVPVSTACQEYVSCYSLSPSQLAALFPNLALS